MMQRSPEVLYGVILPAVIACGACIASRRPWRADLQSQRCPPWRWGSWGPTLALGAAVVIAFEGMKGVRLVPIDSSEWLPHTAAGGALVGIALGGARRGVLTFSAVRAALRLALSAAVMSLVLWWKFRAGWGPATGAAWLALGAGATALHWRATETLFTNMRIRSGLLIAGAATAAAAACIGLTGIASLAMFMGAAAIVLGVCFALLWWRNCGAPSVAAAAPLSLVTVVALALGFTQGRLPLISLIALAGSMIAGGAAMALTERSRGSALRVVIPLLAGLLPLAAALVAAVLAYQPAPEEY